MDAAPIHHKKKVEPLVKPINHIDKAKNELMRRHDTQPTKKEDKSKRKPGQYTGNIPNGYA